MQMQIHILQTDIRWHNPAQNIATAERLMANAPHPIDTRVPVLFVLPEMWATGFDTASRPIQATCDEHHTALQWMRQAAQARRALLAGSIATPEDGRLYNRFYLVRPDGTFATYDKRHLFSYGGEPRTFTAGRERIVVECGGWRILLQVCYDLRFPVFARNGAEGYDLILYVANWPESRIQAWDTLLRARAIENQCYVCGVNRTGRDPLCTYCGGSALIDAYGRTVLSPGQAEGIFSATLDLETLRRFREKFPVLRDADPFRLDCCGPTR